MVDEIGDFSSSSRKGEQSSQSISFVSLVLFVVI
jgi:hypothetical protein